ncbi:MAG: hypothetical protein E6G10_23945 [Actinobacteria bacterium]|nr:MAG: hypothetical protein E6G10_23945 [Actinomycetota bacterium]
MESHGLTYDVCLTIILRPAAERPPDLEHLAFHRHRHPWGPTGARGVVELLYALEARGGGRGLFTGCAAGDSGAALVVEVTA